MAELVQEQSRLAYRTACGTITIARETENGIRNQIASGRKERERAAEALLAAALHGTAPLDWGAKALAGVAVNLITELKAAHDRADAKALDDAMAEHDNTNAKKAPRGEQG